MNRRTLFGRVASAAVVVVAAKALPIAPAVPDAPLTDLYAMTLRNAGLISVETACAMWKIDWPVSEAVFNERSVARVTGVVL